MIRKAFTLIELLVVISIISLLVTILMPSLGRARALAQHAACASTVNGLGKALALYTTDNETYPCKSVSVGPETIASVYAWVGSGGSETIPSTSYTYSDYDNGGRSRPLSTYMMGVMKCPSDDGLYAQTGSSYISNTADLLAEGVQNLLAKDAGGNPIPVYPSIVKRPARFVCFMEAGMHYQTVNEDPDFGWDHDSLQWHWDGPQYNALMADGHVGEARVANPGDTSGQPRWTIDSDG